MRRGRKVARRASSIAAIWATADVGIRLTVASAISAYLSNGCIIVDSSLDQGSGSADGFRPGDELNFIERAA
jgi:hypothetical protein